MYFRLRTGQHYRKVSKKELAALLYEWRELEDSCARAENSLMRYYLRTRTKMEPVLTVMAA